MVFISYTEPNAEYNWLKLKERFPLVKRVHGVKGIHQAHIEAAKQCLTKMFWVIDGDAEILNTFEFNFRTRQYDTVYVWRSKNPINDLEYGNGGVKLLPKYLTLKMRVDTTDMTTSISDKFVPVKEVSNITAFNSDPFNTWKSAFRECCKLASKTIDRQKVDETESRLSTWVSKGSDRPYGEYAIKGAKDGIDFVKSNMYDTTLLKKINDFDFLKELFKKYE